MKGRGDASPGEEGRKDKREGRTSGVASVVGPARKPFSYWPIQSNKYNLTASTKRWQKVHVKEWRISQQRLDQMKEIFKYGF
jgi:hypothetical protein